MIKLKILALLCSFAFTLNLFANEHIKRPHENHIYKNLDYLKLDTKQYEAIKELLIEYRKKYTKYYHHKRKEEEKLKNLFQKEYFDKDEYKEIAEEIYEDAIKLEAKILKEIHNILNAQQREQFSYYLQEWRVE